MSEKKYITCPKCGAKIREYRNPLLTVDIIIELPNNRVVLIERKNPPHGWALPGGFVDYGESLENAAAREAKEETSLEIFDLEQFRAYSDPDRDPRHHTVTVVFVAKAAGEPVAGDDAKNVRVFDLGHLPQNMAFDHGKILADYMQARQER
ncbi:MAG TPA: NUDIX hydrolase [Deltaproteobacteria bacterium]|nr:NUDIX hydrolase [Deltaproteobacteria bacterium]